LSQARRDEVKSEALPGATLEFLLFGGTIRL
jgi:hypothetical protein